MTYEENKVSAIRRKYKKSSWICDQSTTKNLIIPVVQTRKNQKQDRRKNQ
jgi:hypothetical protein